MDMNGKIFLVNLFFKFSLYRPHEICLNGKTALYNDDTLNERINLLNNENIRTYIFWECEVVKALEDNPQMSLFFDELPDTGPLFPRDAFHGFIIFLIF